MKKYKVYIIIGILLAIVFLAVPFIFDNFILGYNPNSRTTGDAWAGFWGGYLGALVGAIATILAIRMQINYSNEQARINEEKKIRPYLRIITSDMQDDFHVMNIGMQAACNVKVSDEEGCIFDCSTINTQEIRKMYETRMLMKLGKTSYMFYFSDIIGNQYQQEMKINIVSDNTGNYWMDSCTSKEPQKC